MLSYLVTNTRYAIIILDHENETYKVFAENIGHDFGFSSYDVLDTLEFNKALYLFGRKRVRFMPQPKAPNTYKDVLECGIAYKLEKAVSISL